MPVNVKLNDANFSLGPLSGFFYSVSKDLNELLQVEADGTVANSFPISLSQLRNPVTELHYDGTFFWTLEDLPSDLGIVIKKWRLYPFKTHPLPNVTPIEFRWQDELTLIHGPNIRWSSRAFAVEHYHRTMDGSFLRGASTIKLDSVDHLSVGTVVYLGPSTFTGFVGNEESKTVIGINTSTRFVTLSSSLENSYISTDPVDYHKSIFIFNDNSFSGTADGRGTLVQFSWPGKQQFITDGGGKYTAVRAADFDQTKLTWVRGPQIIQLDIFSPTFDLEFSLEANLMESDLSTQINVFDMISDLGGHVIYKLQDRETTENISLGTYTTTVFTPAPNYNFQTQTTLPVVNSIALEFDTRHILPFPSSDKMHITAIVRDQFNLPVLAQSVQFSAALNSLSGPGSPGTFSPVIAITNVSGTATTQYTPSSTPTSILLNITGKVL
jgi:hypothetical protein